jgi:hypothetical protein
VTTPFDLRPGVRVRLVRVPDVLNLAERELALRGLTGRVGTVAQVTVNKVAWVCWDEGGEGPFTAECLELVRTD